METVSISASSVGAGLALGLALAGAPGPVQAVLLSESVRGGIARGARAMAGANLTFALLMVAVALGVSLAVPRGLVLRFLLVAGGGLLLWLAVDGFRSANRVQADDEVRRSLPPSVRGALAVVLNPGAWLFLAAVASPLFASAALTGGRGGSLLAAAGLAIGLAIGDGAIVLVGGLGVRRAGARAGVWVRRGLAIVLAALGVWLLVRGLLVET